jgi:hypothetical protein
VRVFLCDTLLVVAREEIQFGKVACPTEAVDQFIDAGEGVSVLLCNVI